MSGYDYLSMLQGAHIFRAERVGAWLCLDTNNGSVHVAGGRVRLDLLCKKCGEQRLVEIVTTAGKEEGVCSVCAFAWTLRKEMPVSFPVGSTGE
jgi:hypothetical protein